MEKIVAIIILIVGIAIFGYAPVKYDFSYSIFCGVIYCIIIIAYYLIRKKENYFDFDSLFFVTFFFVTLYYPIFMYETDATRYVFFLYSFDKDVMPKSSALAVLGTSSYICGSLLFASKKIRKKEIVIEKKKRLIGSKKFYFISLSLFVLYIMTGGYFELRAVYFGGGEEYEANAISKYIYLFCPAFLFAGIISDFYNSKIIAPEKFSFKNFSTLSYVTILIITGGLLFAGSRTVPIQIILMIIGLYSLLYKNVTLLRFVTYIFIGLFAMFTIVLLRGYQQDSEMAGADVAMDLIINNRNNFLAIEQVNKYSYTYGESMLSPLVAPIPFFQNLLIDSGFREENITSQKLFTFLTYGELYKFYGIGTTIIADIYIAFGAIGSVVFMALLGGLINRSRIKANYSIYSLTTYAIFISYAVYLARAEYFFFMRYLIWTLIIIIFTQKRFKFS